MATSWPLIYREAILPDSIDNPEWQGQSNWPPDPTNVNRLSLLRSGEFHLYGSERLGLHEQSDTLAVRMLRYDGFLPTGEPDTVHFGGLQLIPNAPTDHLADANGVFQHQLSRGHKRLECKNHLGNVLAVVSDRKLPINNAGSVNGYLPDLISVQDYYPFGMAMLGREVDFDQYRFGFQGQEEDHEYLGGAVNYKYRVHDVRIGRFLSLDPLAPEYPKWSPYAFSENRVVDAIELEGLEEVRYFMKPEYKEAFRLVIEIAQATDLASEVNDVLVNQSKWNLHVVVVQFAKGDKSNGKTKAIQEPFQLRVYNNELKRDCVFDLLIVEQNLRHIALKYNEGNLERMLEYSRDSSGHDALCFEEIDIPLPEFEKQKEFENIIVVNSKLQEIGCYKLRLDSERTVADLIELAREKVNKGGKTSSENKEIIPADKKLRLVELCFYRVYKVE